MNDTMSNGTVKRRSWVKIAGLALGLGAQVMVGQVAAQVGGVKLNTTQVNVQQMQRIDLSRLLQVAPAFGSAALPAGLRLVQGDEASRFAALGTPTWITASSLQSSSSLRAGRLSSNLQLVSRAAQSSAVRPELTNLLRLAQTRPFVEPVLQVETKSGPL